MKESYTLAKARNYSSNIDYFFAFFPFLIAYFMILFAISWVSVESLHGFMMTHRMGFESAFKATYNTILLFFFYIPVWIFVKSIYTYEAIYFTKEIVTIEKQFLGFRKSRECISTNLVRQATLGLTAQQNAARGSQEFGSALTICAIVDCYRKEHRFGFWLSLYDQGIIVSEMSSFLNTLRKK
jgi:hypothetical protein